MSTKKKQYKPLSDLEKREREEKLFELIDKHGEVSGKEIKELFNLGSIGAYVSKLEKEGKIERRKVNEKMCLYKRPSKNTSKEISNFLLDSAWPINIPKSNHQPRVFMLLNTKREEYNF